MATCPSPTTGSRTRSGRLQSPGHSAHVGQEVEVFYRWRPLYGRRVRRQYSEQRANAEVVHLEVGPGIVMNRPGGDSSSSSPHGCSVPRSARPCNWVRRASRWMRSTSCTISSRNKDFGEAARVFITPARSAMTQIFRLRRSVTTSASPQSQSHRQLRLTFVSSVLRGMTSTERSNVIA